MRTGWKPEPSTWLVWLHWRGCPVAACSLRSRPVKIQWDGLPRAAHGAVFGARLAFFRVSFHVLPRVGTWVQDRSREQRKQLSAAILPSSSAQGRRGSTRSFFSPASEGATASPTGSPNRVSHIVRNTLELRNRFFKNRICINWICDSERHRKQTENLQIGMLIRCISIYNLP